MKMSPQGRKILILREGYRLSAYRDSVGIPTIGVGHIDGVKMGDTISARDVDRLLTSDLARFEQAVSSAVHVPLSQTEFDALVSFAFNIGANAFKGSTTVRRLNEGNRKAAADAMLLWNKPPEIMGRRRAERTQFMSNQPMAVQPAPPDIEPVPAPTSLSWWQRLFRRSADQSKIY